MDDDIVKQAALRRQRRTRRDVDEIFGDCRPRVSKDVEPPNKVAAESDPDFPKHSKGTKSEHEQHLSLPRIHNFRRRPFADRPVSYNNQSSLCLPFINIKLFETEAKALINSCVMTSIINRHLYQNIFACDVTTGQPGTDKAREIPIRIGGKVFHFDLLIRGDIPDLVLGLDFLTVNKCSIDFGNKTFTLQGEDDVTVKLISDRDLPLRYRHGGNLVASV